MNSIVHTAKAVRLRRRISLAFASIFGVLTLMMMILLASAPASAASPTTVGLGTSGTFAVLAGTTVTNTGSTVLSGNLGLDPGTSITGFPPGSVINGSTYTADPTALQAQSDLTTAYNDAASRTPTGTIAAGLGGQTLDAGVYNSASSIGLTGTLTLDGQNNPNAVFIFQAVSTLITESASTVSLINGAQACNVFWQVGSSATIGTTNTFVGTVMALTSGTVETGSTVQGRILARNGQVSLGSNTITVPSCAAVSSPVATTTTTSTTAAPTTTTTTASAATTTTTTSPLVIPASGPGPSGVTVIPVGAPQTGFGGAARSTDHRAMFVFGGLSLLGALSAGTQVLRSRRSVSKSDTGSN